MEKNGGIKIVSTDKIVYGPVPSRRFGRSLGINNIPPKHCSYSCVYCQLGRTKDLQIKRRRFYGPDRVFQDVEAQVSSVEEMGDRIDHLTFVPDGEPTLDIDLGKEIEMVKELGYPVAVITNSSLMGNKDVREELSGADLVSVKVDAVNRSVWRNVNRPHGHLELKEILDGLMDFSDISEGALITETMLVDGIFYEGDPVEMTAKFIHDLDPKIAFITVPIRPPSEKWVLIPSDESLLKAIKAFTNRKIRTVPLTDKEYGDFTYTGDVKNDILSITSVHPMREDSVREMLHRSGDEWDVVKELVGSGKLLVTGYQGINFYRRSFERRRDDNGE